MKEQLGMTSDETFVVHKVLVDELDVDGDVNMEELVERMDVENILEITTERIDKLEASENKKDIRRAATLRDANTNMMLHEEMLS